MPAARGTYAGKTADERVEQRRAALIDAAMTIVAEQGWRRLTIDRLCEQAGLIRRYFYESFPDVDALATAVVDEIYAGIVIVTVQDDKTKAQPLPDLARIAIAALVDYFAEDPRRVKVVFAEMASTESAVTHRRSTADRLTEIFAVEARSLKSLPADDPLIDLAARMLLSGTGHILLDWVDGVIPFSRDELVEAITRLWTGLAVGLLSGT